MNYKQELDQCLQSDFTELFAECKRQGVARFAEFLQVWKRFGMVRIHNYYLPIPRVTKLAFLSSVCDVVMNDFLTNANVSLLMIKVYSLYSLYIISCCATEKDSCCRVSVNFRNWQVLEKAHKFFEHTLKPENTNEIAAIASTHLVKLRYCANDFLKAYDYMRRSGKFLFSLSTTNSGILTKDLAKFNPSFPRDEFDAVIDKILMSVGRLLDQNIHTPPPKKRACFSSSGIHMEGSPTKKGIEGYFEDESDEDGENTVFWQDGFQKEVIGDFTEPCTLNMDRIGKFLNVYCASKELFIEKHGSEDANTRMLNIVNKGYWNGLDEDIARYLELRQSVASDVMKFGHTKSGFITSKIVEGSSLFVPRNAPASVIPVTVEVKNGTDERPKVKPKKVLPKKGIHSPVHGKEKDRWSKNEVINEPNEGNENFVAEEENYVSGIISGDGTFIQCNYNTNNEINKEGNVTEGEKEVHRIEEGEEKEDNNNEIDNNENENDNEIVDENRIEGYLYDCEEDNNGEYGADEMDDG